MKLHGYQKKAANYILRKKRVALFADPGMGKTAIILSVLDLLRETGKYKKALVVAPSIVCSNVWPNEINKWKRFRRLRKIYQLNPRIRKEYEYKTSIKSFIHIVNFESLPGLCKRKKALTDYDILIIDESSKMKNPSSVRFKALKKCLDNFKYIVIMSGTPIPKSMLDLWSQIYIVDKGKRLGENITSYRNRYFNSVMRRFGAHIVPEYSIKKGAKKKILKEIAPVSIVLRAKDYLDIKDVIINDIPLYLTKTQRIIYDQMEKNLFTEINMTELFAMSAGSSFQKCHQLANGAIWDGDNKGRYLHLHDLKLDALSNIIDELQGKPVLVGYRFIHDLERIKKRFGNDVSILDKNNPRIEKQWNQGKHKILCGQFQSVSHGLNLQKGGHDIILFSLTSNWENYDQFIKRIWRQGVEQEVRVHRFIVKDTVDETLIEILDKRCKNQSDMLKILKGYVLNRKSVKAQVSKKSTNFNRNRCYKPLNY